MSQKVSAFTPLVVPELADLVAIIDDPSGTPIQKAITIANLIYKWISDVDADSKNLNNAVIVTPTIASFVNAAHDHEDAAGGANLASTAISDFNAAVQTNRIDEMAVPTATVDNNGQDFDNIQNLIHDISTSGTDIDFLEDELQTFAVNANTTFTTVNRAIGVSKTIKLLADGSLRTLTFPSWIFVGAKPTDIAANKTAILTLTNFGTTDALIVAAYAVEE